MRVAVGRAEAKFNELDEDRTGDLTGTELLRIAKWQWTSCVDPTPTACMVTRTVNPNPKPGRYRPGEQITADHLKKEAAILLQRCDTDGDGAINKPEFLKFYELTTQKLLKLKKAPTATTRAFCEDF